MKIPHKLEVILLACENNILHFTCFSASDSSCIVLLRLRHLVITNEAASNERNLFIFGLSCRVLMTNWLKSGLVKMADFLPL